MSDRVPRDSGFNDRLAELAGMAGRSAHQPEAPAIRRRGRRRVLRQRAAVAALAVVVLTAGAVSARFIAPAHPPELPGGSPTPTRTRSAESSPGPTATGSPAQSPPSNGTSATPAWCRRPVVAVSAGAQNAGSGHRSVVLLFTNTGSEACRLTGYPGVAGLDAAGTQVAQAQRARSGYAGGLVSGGSAPIVTLAPGQAASALVEALAFNATDGSHCTAFAGLLVTVPDDTASTRVPWGNDGCSALQVHPVVPGTTGQSG
jgi:hypothetical protein